MSMLKETFLNSIRNRHPENFSKYDYSLVPDEFKVISSTMIKIICLKHGVFEQRLRDHLHKNTSCKKCQYEKVSYCLSDSLESFISKAKLIHNYDYSKVYYVNSHTKVEIICFEHGSFFQTPGKHLFGRGCPKCGINKRMILRRSNTEEFIRKARLIHGNKYDYSKVIYIDSKTKVIIICKTHGDFLQTPSDHLNGCGCPKCRESFGEKYISQALDKLNIKYIREYRIPEYRYKYDFYLPDYNIYIEYHGRQHYESDEFFGGKDKFEKTQRNDLVKVELIKRSSGLLIAIKYTFNTKEQIENELIRLFTFIHPQFLTNKETVKQSIIDSNIYLIEDGRIHKRN